MKKKESPRDFGFASMHIEQDAIRTIENAHSAFVESAPGMSYKGPTKSDFLKFLVRLQMKDYKGRFILVATRGRQGTVMFDTEKWQAVTVYRDQGHIVCYPIDGESKLYLEQAKRFNKAMFTGR